MRWPRLNLGRSEGSEPPRSPSRAGSSSSSSETPQADKDTNTPPAHDRSLARLFSDAASYDRIFKTDPDDTPAAPDALNGFSHLVARDLEDHERVASETLAQLSVTNWTPGESPTLAPDVGVDEADESASEGEQDRIEPSASGITQPAVLAVEPEFEDKLKADEILDLLQQDFGALAPPGEEKLLLETDATLFEDVVILVCQLMIIYRHLLTGHSGGGAPHHTSPYISCIAPVVSTRPKRKNFEVWSGSRAPQGAAPQEESLAPVNTRHD
jgi:sterol 3beta-glucosyltransferase